MEQPAAQLHLVRVKVRVRVSVGSHEGGEPPVGRRHRPGAPGVDGATRRPMLCRSAMA